MEIDREELRELITSTMKTVLVESRAITEEQHIEDHAWTKARRAAADKREKYINHCKTVALGVITVSGLALLAKAMAWVGKLVVDAWNSGIY